MFRFVKQPLGRAADLPLLTVLAGELPPDEGIADEAKEKKGDDKDENWYGEFPDQEDDPRENRNDEDEKIREDVLPGDRHRSEPFRDPLFKKQGTEPAFPERTGLPEIVTVRAVPAEQPEFEDEDKQEIRCDPDDAEPQEKADADQVDGQRHKV